ncbi:MAG: hypothetical protein GFH27_549289n154 [Chloroflexi bacterium AL-W]|nr:hypothetical protein [Chloroflexi bacterium AL-N1]NOK66887.1 hypothetical protein [Chloroflexi bacterium AL-N10]NOK74821.1 hypothetical protein [Chloroflexi bacterium AL-N5]NOK81489.1 hypothetical protein [Chloroflexi bacterium AL-W]NOK88959.1 hypothetical protein [Chloroflexi bacterium AL-N15]
MIAQRQPQTMSLGDLFDAACMLYRAHFGIFAGITTLLYIPMAMMQFLILGPSWLSTSLMPVTWSARLDFLVVLVIGENNMHPLQQTLFYLLVIQELLFIPIIAGLLTHLMKQIRQQEQLSVRASYPAIIPRLSLLIIATIMPFLINGLIAIVAVQLFARPMVVTGFPLILNDPERLIRAFSTYFEMEVLWLPVILIIMFVYVHLLFITPIIILEHGGILRSYRRSWQLVRVGFWRTLMTLICTKSIAYMHVWASQTTLIFLLSVTSTGLFPFATPLAFFIVFVGSLIGQVLLFPVGTIVFTLLYYDLQTRLADRTADPITDTQTPDQPSSNVSINSF